jgi:hypothetical protein
MTTTKLKYIKERESLINCNNKKCILYAYDNARQDCDGGFKNNERYFLSCEDYKPQRTLKNFKTPIYTLKANATYRAKTKKITLPNELAIKLKEYAKQRNVKVSDAVSDLLSQYIL